MKEISIQNKVIDFLQPQQITQFTGKWLDFGADNQAPQMFSLLGRTVSNHRALLNSKTRYTAGSRIEGNDIINNNGLSIKNIVERMMFDEFSTGNTFLELVTDANSSFLQLYHVDSTKGRLAKDLKSVYFHPTWVNVGFGVEIIQRPIYPNYIVEDGLRKSVIWKSQYEPEFINGIPIWYAGLRTAVISGLIDESNKSELENSHGISGMLFIPNVSDTEAKILSDDIHSEDGLTGAENHGKLKIGYYNGDSNIKPELLDFRRNVEGNYVDLKDVSNNQLLMIHSWYRSLAGYQDSTGFDTNRINDEYKVALTSSILPKQAEYATILNNIFSAFNKPEIEFINESPTEEISDNDLLTVWEMREKKGMEFNKEDPAQQILIYQLKK